MKPMKPAVMFVLSVAIATAIVVGSSRGKEVPKPKATPAAEAKAAPEASAPAVTLGDPATARWTATTIEAGPSELNKKVLAGGRIATVTGEIVDVSCYLQLGKRGEAHVACGSKCIANGEPIGIVDASDKLYILFAEEHHPRRDGAVSLRKTVGSLLAKTVTLTGMATETKETRALYLQAAEIDSVMAQQQKSDGK